MPVRARLNHQVVMAVRPFLYKPLKKTSLQLQKVYSNCLLFVLCFLYICNYNIIHFHLTHFTFVWILFNFLFATQLQYFVMHSVVICYFILLFCLGMSACGDQLGELFPPPPSPLLRQSLVRLHRPMSFSGNTLLVKSVSLCCLT